MRLHGLKLAIVTLLLLGTAFAQGGGQFGSGAGSGNVSAGGTLTSGAGLIGSGGSAIAASACTTDNGTTWANICVTNMGTTGQTSFAAGGGVSKYRGTSTGGVGMVAVFGTPVNLTNQTASVGTTQILSSTPAAGQYEVELYVDERTACTTVSGSQVVVTVNWTDATLARSKSVTLTFDTSNVAADSQSLNIPIFAANASSINLTTTYTGCATGGPAAYDLKAAVTQLQ